MEKRSWGAPTIQTDYLKIYGNVLEFKDTTLQLSNISLLSTTDIAPARFPGWSVVLILLGAWRLPRNIVLSLLVIAAGAAWIYFWYGRAQKVKQLKRLIIITNSGNTFSIVFNDQTFLNEVVNVLNGIIANPAAHGDVTINVKDNILQGNASVVQTLLDFSSTGKGE